MGVIIFLGSNYCRHTNRILKIFPAICDKIRLSYPQIQNIQYFRVDDVSLPRCLKNTFLIPKMVYIPNEIWTQISNGDDRNYETHSYVMKHCDLFNVDAYVRWLQELAPITDEDLDTYDIKEPEYP